MKGINSDTVSVFSSEPCRDYCNIAATTCSIPS